MWCVNCEPSGPLCLALGRWRSGHDHCRVTSYSPPVIAEREVDAPCRDASTANRTPVRARRTGNRRFGDVKPRSDRLRPTHRALHVQRLDAAGKVVAPTDFVSLPVESSDIEVAKQGGSVVRTIHVADGTPYRMLTTAAAGGGALQIARELTATENLLNSLRNPYAVLSVVVSAVAAAIGWVIARRSTRSLMRLTAAVEDVGAPAASTWQRRQGWRRSGRWRRLHGISRRSPDHESSNSTHPRRGPRIAHAVDEHAHNVALLSARRV